MLEKELQKRRATETSQPTNLRTAVISLMVFIQTVKSIHNFSPNTRLSPLSSHAWPHAIQYESPPTYLAPHS